MIPVYKGRFDNGVELAKMVTEPFMSPEEPKLAMARPMMRVRDDGAPPHISELARK
jgi:hypothetical protein